jgi:hypothetical protein
MRDNCPEARTKTQYEGEYYYRLKQLLKTNENLYFYNNY